MNDQPNDNQQYGSYVDDYQPPQEPVQATNPAPAPAAQSQDQPQAQPQPQGEQPQAVTTPQPQPAQNKTASQSLEDQNIFDLLGVNDGTSQEKEAFLDELQQVIWEDFLDQDVQLLITESEMADMKQISEKQGLTEEQRQEEIVTFLEKLIPDLEEIMLEKALELKADMVRERIAGLKEYYAGKAEELKQVDEAERLINDDQWKSAADLLNGMVS